ncbi:TFP11-domain-containing protein [Cutaneotrichosporon oleaginosum]|uniref:TFP11-domain-containing protein n=1 Tax=Cutaneotrichosporon oleaginosum TaxID=879819 RepID=A0A0J0XFA7_9TREE|nr:TFP11-domain-containing protein [Cutaneotrichosporon oleaginosum]KLT39752.1 TFP11-domain-containing protein [Cutaneotrichosporon oleaginosum]TXT12238.1 hypothetical protein COLE_02648 [Cutaneotrichosporon oleaginosum]
MARRKKDILDDGTDSDASDQSGSEGGFGSQEDDDSRAERRLFEHRRKRPRTMGNGKAAAWEGIFGEGDDGGGLRRPRSGGVRPGNERTDWTKAPAFVSKSDAPHDGAKGADSELDKPTDGLSDGSDAETSSNNEIATPRVVEEEEAPHAGIGGGGRGGLGFRAGGGGGGLGFRLATATTAATKPSVDEAKSDGSAPKSAFGRAASAFMGIGAGTTPNARSGFQPSRSATPTPTQQAALTRAEQAHFSSIAGGFGAKFLAKQGWAPGKGLGLNEDGRAVPVAVGAMMRGEGIRSGIRTEDSKREARRKGELVEDEEPKPKKGQRKAGQRGIPSREGWTKHKKVKVKVEHKTYEQLLAEETIDRPQPGVGLVIDARGPDLKTVESIADLSISGWTPSLDATQLPELRHNLRLVVDVTRGEVNSLVKEGKAVNERRRWTTRDEERSRQKADESATELRSLERVKASVDEIFSISQREVSEGSSSLRPLEEAFNRLLVAHEKEYRLLGLDDVVVGAIDLVLRKPFAQWQPFDVSADALLSTLKPWKQAFNLDNASRDPQVDGVERSMTAWESLLWQRWLPKVRSAINNEWDVWDPQPAVHLIESWDPILPRFIYDNVLDQLILPKVTMAVEEWTGRSLRDGRNVSLASITFPWLPLMGERVGDLLESGKRRVRAVLRRWKPEDGALLELQRWRGDIFSVHEWDKLMGDYVLGKLGDVLRDRFAVNPRNQDMKPLKDILLPWHSLIRTSNFVRLFELEFFPKWLNVLYTWLAHPGYNADEVAQWFEMWKAVFPPQIVQHRGMAHGFNTGLKLMREAVELGSAAPLKLQQPQYAPIRSNTTPSNGGPQLPTLVPMPGGKRILAPEDLTFRSVVEEIIAENDLLMRPLGQSHATTGKPLFRIGKTIEGKGGLVVYFGEDAVFAQGEDGTFRATSVEEVLNRVR